MIILRRIPAILCASALLTACGGGSGGGSAGPGEEPEPENRSPVLVQPATDQHLTLGRAFTYDVSRGGAAVTDPDGDPLTYQVRVISSSVGSAFPDGLKLSKKTVISGVPTRAGIWEFEIQVDDDRGGSSVFYRFMLRVAPNSAPTIVDANLPQLVAVGMPVDYDASQAGTTFADPDGDPVTYRVELRGAHPGFQVSGTRIRGAFGDVGAMEASITASDAFGNATTDSFLLAAAAPAPSVVPSLPATSYVYRDEELPLPYLFRLSSETQIPFWDTQPVDNRTTNEGATLGRVLFYDKRLSITNTLSCSSCHQQGHGFASPARFDSGVLGLPLKRNSMALANARYSIQNGWFSDMSVRGDLRNLMFVPIESHDELGMARMNIELKLASTDFYPALFSAAFGTPEVTRERIAAAIAQFVQSLISYSAKLDDGINPMQNEPFDPSSVFSEQEMHGRDLFQSHCSACHDVNVSTNRWQANNGLDMYPADPGTQDPELQRNGALGVFRAAALRNVALTGPYMHDGRFATLREVIEHYDQGVQDSPYLDGILRGPDGPFRLDLSEDDKASLEAFLHTFTDEAFLTDPKFSDPFDH